MTIKDEIQKRKKQGKMRASNTVPQPKKEPDTYYKLHREHDEFIVMLNYTIEKDLGIHEYINKWWNNAFPGKQFPEGRTLQEIKIAIQYGLIHKAHKEQKIKPKEKFLQGLQKALNFEETLITRCERENNLSKTIIFKKEFTMAKAKAKAKETKKTATVKKEKKPNQCGMITELLCEKKHTDEQILALVKKIIPDGSATKAWVSGIRGEINSGKRKVPDGTVIPISEIGGKTEEKAAPAPKAKAKAKKK